MISFLANPRRKLLVTALAVLTIAGCSSDDSATLGAQFTASATPTAPRLVKLVRKSSSGSRIVVQAVIYGPDVTLDMYSFAFDVKIGDPTVLNYVASSAIAGNALVAFAGQTIQVIVSASPTDSSDIVCGISKLGGGVGNGVAGASAVIVEMAFNVKKAGTTSLTITGNGVQPAQVLDSNGAVIGTISFDAAAATVKGVSSGGSGGY